MPSLWVTDLSLYCGCGWANSGGATGGGTVRTVATGGETHGKEAAMPAGLKPRVNKYLIPK